MADGGGGEQSSAKGALASVCADVVISHESYHRQAGGW
jgi:hypothetical protein